MSQTAFFPKNIPSITAFPIPPSRLDGRTMGLGVLLEGRFAGSQSEIGTYLRAARSAGARMIGRREFPQATLLGFSMPTNNNTRSLFLKAGLRNEDVVSAENRIDLRDDDLVMMRFAEAVRRLPDAGDGAFAPEFLGTNIARGEVWQRLFGRTFTTHDGKQTHGEWEIHRGGGMKGDGDRRSMFLRAETMRDWTALAMTLVASLDYGDRENIGSGTLSELRRIASVDNAPGAVEITSSQFRELIEQSITAVTAAGRADRRSLASRFSVGLPAHDERNARRMANAQFSTPPAVGRAAAEFLHPKGRTLLEPTIGNGLLAASSVAQGALLFGMELDDARAQRAREAFGLPGGGRIKTVDALNRFLWASSPADRAGRFDMVVTNPPYMRLEDGTDQQVERKIKLTGTDVSFVAKTAETWIAAVCINRLKPGGNGVFVMPAEMMKPTEINGHRRQFQSLLTAAFERVRSVVLNAPMYVSMGANFPVIVHFAEGRRAMGDEPELGEIPALMPSEFPMVKSYDEFFAFVDREVLEPSQIKDATPEEQEVNRTAVEAMPELPDDLVSDAEETEAEEADQTAQETVVKVAGRAAGRDVRERNSADRQSSQAQETTKPTEKPTEAEPTEAESEVNEFPDPVSSVSFYLDDFEADPFTVAYEPFSKKIRSRFNTPTVIERTMASATHQALARVAAEHGDIDHFVADQLDVDHAKLVAEDGPLSPEQIDGIALTLHNRLGKKATIVGDLMGVGKGRQLAAHMRSSLIAGNPLLVMTNGDHLFNDLLNRDLSAVSPLSTREQIERGQLKPFIFNASPRAQLRDRGEKKAFFGTNATERGQVRESGISEDYNCVCSTYSQLQIASAGWRVAAMKDWIIKNAEAGRTPLIVLDEVHQAAGADSNTGLAIRSLLDTAEQYGCEIVHSSATSMKSGKNLSLYAQALPNTGMSLQQLLDVVEKNPLAMQEVLSSEMARSGSLFQRKMSSAGVERSTERLADINEERMSDALDMWVNFASVLQKMQDATPAIRAAAMRQAQLRIGGTALAGSANKLNTDTVSPATMYDNISRYFLLAIKGQFLKELVEDTLARGEKPLLLQEFTADSLSEWVFSQGDMAQDDILDMDQDDEPQASYSLPASGLAVNEYPHLGHVLKRAINRMLEVKANTAMGDSTEFKIEGFDSWRDDIFESIDRVNFSRWRLNTLDMAQEVADDLGITFADITSRGYSFQKGEDGIIRAFTRKREDRAQSSAAFNAGKIDMIAFNSGAATGLSMHSSPAEGPDLRRRNMIFMTFLKNLFNHTQAEGRADRVGQVSPPRYTIPTTGTAADDRLASLYNRGTRSMSSMTAGTRESSRTVRDAVDLLNPIGDMAARAVLENSPEVGLRMGIAKSDEGLWPSDLGRKVLGRSFALGPESCASLLGDIDVAFGTIAARLDREGKNPLRLGRHDWQAKVEVVEVLESGDDNAATIAGLPLNLIQISYEEDRPVEKADVMMRRVQTYLHGQSQRFERLWERLDLESVDKKSTAHPLYDPLTGRAPLGEYGKLFPVPMPVNVMEEIFAITDRFVQREREKSKDGVLLDPYNRDVMGKIEDILKSRILRKPEDGTLDVERGKRRGGLSGFITAAVNEQGKPAFEDFKWRRPVGQALRRREAINEIKEFAKELEPGRLVAVDLRALPPFAAGEFDEAFRELGLLGGAEKPPVYLPAMITSARYDEKDPMSKSGMRVSLFIPGTDRVFATNMAQISGNMALSGSADGASGIKPIGEFMKLVRAEVGKVVYSRERGSEVSDTELPVLSRLFPKNPAAVATAMGTYWQELSRRDNAQNYEGTWDECRRAMEIAMDRLPMAVESASAKGAFAADMFEVMCNAMPDGVVERKRFGLTGNLISAAASVSGDRRSEGEKVVFSDEHGNYINAFLLNAADQKATLSVVRARSAARSRLIEEVHGGDVDKMRGLLDLQSVMMRFMRDSSLPSNHNETILGDDYRSRFAKAVQNLYPDMDRDNLGQEWLDENAESILTKVLDELAAKWNGPRKTFPASVIIGQDIWASHMSRSGAENKKSKIASADMPCGISAWEKDGGGASFKLSYYPEMLTEALTKLDKDQMIGMFDGDGDVTVFFKKQHPLLKDKTSVFCDKLSEAINNVNYPVPMRLKQSVLGMTVSMSDPKSREFVTNLLAEQTNAPGAEVLLGGIGKDLMGALSQVLVEIERQQRKDMILGSINDLEQNDEKPAPPENDNFQQANNGPSL